ncbi:extracellular solute-binding protein [Gracilibacillus sp. YIM 98692]|uniref:ABC transporter substrate-binding protein n=1 Tax=Gracilibacillus sp. YIM 98692 TaxID=2663532 RepID=UPI0013D80C72|nr:extracellular solute-binding protein [Gracilibacillus sp. YIM 98692]
MRYVIYGIVYMMFVLIGCDAGNLKEAQEAEQPKELEFFSFKTETEPIFNELINEFESDHPDIKIKQVIDPNGASVLKSRIAKGDVPDIFITYPMEADYVIRAKKRYLLDLTEEKFIHDINPIIQKRYTVDGDIYGVALTQNAVGVLYNKEHLSDLGLSAPQTWDEFLQSMNKLEESGYNPLIMPNKEAMQTSIFTLNIVANTFGEEYWLQDRLSIKDSNDWKKASQKILDVLQYVDPASYETGYYEANKKFADGEASYYIMGTWALPLIEQHNPNLNYGIFPFPANNQTTQHPVLGGVDIGLAIDAETKYPDAAKKFLEFLTRKENARRLSHYEGSISAVKNVQNTKEEIQLLVEMMEQGKSINWPNHYWPGGTAAELDFRNYSLEFFYEQDIDDYLNNLDNMFQKYYE